MPSPAVRSPPARLQLPLLPLLLLLLPLTSLCSGGSSEDAAAAVAQQGRELQLPNRCSRFSALWDSGPGSEDLAYWQRLGVTEDMAQQSVSRHASLPNRTRNALMYAFVRGRALVLPVDLSTMGTHALLQLPYIKLLLHLEEAYGAEHLPDVDFVLTTEDMVPVTKRVADAKALNKAVAPQFRYGKSNWSTDLLFPNFHFGLKRYDTDLLDHADDTAALYPWSRKLPVAFGRFSSYYRVLPSRYHSPRLGASGESLCQRSSCSVRQHFAEWAARYAAAAAPPPGVKRPAAAAAAPAASPPPPGAPAWSMDVGLHGRVPLPAHAGYKYLVHLDGVALSSRLEQLLTLNSLVLKEDSGYFAFYHHLLVPGRHYLPFWAPESTPQDLLPQLDWAAAHDDEAERIAQAGQALAKEYLQAKARHCYVVWLLQGYARALQYAPPLARWADAMVPLRSFAEEQLWGAERGTGAKATWAAGMVRAYENMDF